MPPDVGDPRWPDLSSHHLASRAAVHMPAVDHKALTGSDVLSGYEDRCPPKWVVVPRRCPPHAPWSAHSFKKWRTSPA
jgi:hypothetical protein